MAVRSNYSKHSKHSYLYFHVFSTEKPDDFYPDCNQEIVINDNFIDKISDKNSEEYKGFKLTLNSQYGALGNGVNSVHNSDFGSKVSYHFPDTGKEKLKVFELLSKWTGVNASKYYYHGMFIKADNFGRYYFKFIDPEVEKAFNTKKISKKFGI
jgi:hypothetical protein